MPSLITLPIRLPLEITYRAAKLGVEVVRTVAGILERDSAPARAPWPVEEEPPRDWGDSPVSRAVPVEDPAPAHVDTEPELAYEAGPGDDVGAEVHVGPPWAGYDRMRAVDIV